MHQQTGYCGPSVESDRAQCLARRGSLTAAQRCLSPSECIENKATQREFGGMRRAAAQFAPLPGSFSSRKSMMEPRLVR